MSSSCPLCAERSAPQMVKIQYCRRRNSAVSAKRLVPMPLTFCTYLWISGESATCSCRRAAESNRWRHHPSQQAAQSRCSKAPRDQSEWRLWVERSTAFNRPISQRPPDGPSGTSRPRTAAPEGVVHRSRVTALAHRPPDEAPRIPPPRTAVLSRAVITGCDKQFLKVRFDPAHGAHPPDRHTTHHDGNSAATVPLGIAWYF